jgi:hypothetical protein
MGAGSISAPCWDAGGAVAMNAYCTFPYSTTLAQVCFEESVYRPECNF